MGETSGSRLARTPSRRGQTHPRRGLGSGPGETTPPTTGTHSLCAPSTPRTWSSSLSASTDVGSMWGEIRWSTRLHRYDNSVFTFGRRHVVLFCFPTPFGRVGPEVRPRRWLRVTDYRPVHPPRSTCGSTHHPPSHIHRLPLTDVHHNRTDS